MSDRWRGGILYPIVLGALVWCGIFVVVKRVACDS